MNIGKNTVLLLVAAAFSITWASCGRSSGTTDPVDPPAYKLSYGDSILYLQPTAGDYIVNPTTTKPGTYTGFPDGIEIDGVTGAINVSKSETGLRYRITHTAPDGKKTETLVVLSGITFKDRFYHFSTGDTIALPVYNADAARILPISGSNFDEGNTANGGGCSVRTDNGKINLAESVRLGVFGNGGPRNDDQKEIEIKYRVNDGSSKSLNKLKVKLYWYNTMADVPQYLWDILNDRTTQGVFLKGGAADRTGQLAKPRPPCIILVGQ
jgi:hypothetical protein